MNIVSICNVLVIVLSVALFGRASGDGAFDYVKKECGSGLKSIDSIQKFESFVSHYKNWVSNSEEPPRGYTSQSKKLRKCYDMREAFVELDGIILDRHEGVCRPDYVDRLVRFHERYLVEHKDEKPKVSSNSSCLGLFFSLFSHQVAAVCKSKLAPRILEAQSKQDCSVIVNKYLPQSGQDADDNRDAEDIERFMKHFERVEDYNPIISLGKSKEFYYDIVVSPAVIERINSLRADCRAREPYYTALFNSISNLAHLGYSLDDDKEVAADIQESKLLKCWLATAQLCQGILRTNPIPGDDSSEAKLIKVKFGEIPDEVQDPRQPPIVYANDTFDTFSPEVEKVVRKKLTTFSKLKRKGKEFLKKIVESHVDIEGLREAAIGKFVDSLTHDESSSDSRVAFAGKPTNGGQYNPATLVTDEIDSAVQFGSFAFSSKIGLIFSCVNAVALSAVFVWFSLYALVTAARAGPDVHHNYKSDWRQLRDSRMEEVRSKFDKKNPKDLLKVYKE